MSWAAVSSTTTSTTLEGKEGGSNISAVLPRHLSLPDYINQCVSDDECLLVNDCCGAIFGNKYAINRKYSRYWYNSLLKEWCRVKENRMGCGWVTTTAKKTACVEGVCEVSYGGLIDDGLDDHPNPLNFSWLNGNKTVHNPVNHSLDVVDNFTYQYPNGSIDNSSWSEPKYVLLK